MNRPIKIMRYASDLHLELRSTIIHPKLIPLWKFEKSDSDEYYLALLGDIGNPFNQNLELFLEKVSPVYKKIYYIAGNHEYYNYNVKPNRSKSRFHQKLIETMEKFNNVMFLDSKTDYLDGIKIIGTTLWSNVPPHDKEYITYAINDYHLIKKEGFDGELTKITVADTNSWNSEEIAFIEQQISNTNDPCIVLTHHAPLFSDKQNNRYTADPKYLNGENNNAFHNNLAHLLKPPVCAWLYGHTHYTNSFNINNIIVATNQLGYSSEEKFIKFNPYAHIDLHKLMIEQL